MRSLGRMLQPAAAAIVLCLSVALPVRAQGGSSGCTIEKAAGARQIVRCSHGLTITIESGAAYSLLDHNADRVPDAVTLRRKALLLDLPQVGQTGGFEVTTPQAVAAVRGTRWVVDVQRGRTSVFVIRGRVSVQRPAVSSAAVILRPGEGVDVGSGTRTLIVKRWPAARVAALLARFGL